MGLAGSEASVRTWIRRSQFRRKARTRAQSRPLPPRALNPSPQGPLQTGHPSPHPEVGYTQGTVRRLEFVLLVLAAALVAALLSREGPSGEPSASVDAPGPPLEVEGLSILGVRPQMDRAEAERLLGPGRVLQVVDRVETTGYGRLGARLDPALQGRWAVIRWTRDERVASVTGSHLHLRGREILGQGWPSGEIQKTLGPRILAVADGYLYRVGRWQLEVATSRDRVSSFTFGEGPPR